MEGWRSRGLMRRWRASQDRSSRLHEQRLRVLGRIAVQAVRPAGWSRRLRRRGVACGLRQHSGLQKLPSCHTVLRMPHCRDVLQPARRGFVAIGHQPVRKRQASAGVGAPAGRHSLRTPRRKKEQHRAGPSPRRVPVRAACRHTKVSVHHCGSWRVAHMWIPGLSYPSDAADE